MKLSLLLEAKLPTGVLGLAVASDGSQAWAACVDGSIHWVDLDTGESEPFSEKHSSFASACVLLPGDNTLISAGYDGNLFWHDVTSGGCTRRVTAHKFWNWQLALSPDGRRLATTTGQYIPGGWKYEPAPETEPSVKVFDTATGEKIATFAHTPPVLSCAFSPDGKHLAAANMMGEVRVWDWADAANADPIAQWTSPDFTSWGTIKSHHYCGGIYGLAFSPDGKSLLGCGMGPMTDPMAGNGKMTWQIWDWRNGEKLDQIKDSKRGSGLMESVAWHPGGQHFIMAGRQAQGTWNAAVFAAGNHDLVHSLDTKMRITHARFTANGKSLILSGASGQSQPKSGVWPKWGHLQMYKVEV